MIFKNLTELRDFFYYHETTKGKTISHSQFPFLHCVCTPQIFNFQYKNLLNLLENNYYFASYTNSRFQCNTSFQF